MEDKTCEVDCDCACVISPFEMPCLSRWALIASVLQLRSQASGWWDRGHRFFVLRVGLRGLLGLR